MDLIEGLPRSGGVDTITVCTVATVFIREIVRLHGVPLSIVSDRGKVFISVFWEELFKWQGTALKRSSSYHPQTEGQTEVTKRSVEMNLRFFTGAKLSDWSKWLPWAEYWYNTTYHTGPSLPHLGLFMEEIHLN